MPKIHPKYKSSPKLTQSRSCPNLISLDSSLDDNLAAKLHCYKGTQLKKGANRKSENPIVKILGSKKSAGFKSGSQALYKVWMGVWMAGGLPVVLSHSWWGRFVVSVVADVVFRSIYRRLSTAESTV